MLLPVYYNILLLLHVTEMWEFCFPQTGIITVDDCKLAVALSFGTRVGSFSCAAAQRVNPKVDNYRYKKMRQS